jgi:uncharacterized protein YggT (Ycf19 family)
VQLLYVVAATIGLVLRLLYFAMFLFAILSWFVSEDHPIMAVLAVVTTRRAWRSLLKLQYLNK